jgi:O-antigen/teichoic acid export membrane protein
MNLAMMQVILNSLPRLVIFIVALTYLFFNFELTLSLLFKLLIMSYFITVLFALIIYKIKFIPIYDMKLCKKHTSEKYDAMSQFYWVSIASIFMAEAATVLLGIFSTHDQVAYFSIAIRLVSITSFILIAFNSVLSPQFSQFHAQSKTNELISLFQKTRRFGVGISLPILVFIFYFSDSVLIIFGSEFENAANVLRILLIAHLFKVFVGSVGQLLLMTGHVYYQRLSLILAVFLLIILCCALCPEYGAIGAAIATLVAVVCNNLIGLYFVHQKLKIPYHLKTPELVTNV